MPREYWPESDPMHYDSATVAIVEVDAGKCYGKIRTKSVWDLPHVDKINFDFTSENRLALLHVAARFNPLT